MKLSIISFKTGMFGSSGRGFQGVGSRSLMNPELMANYYGPFSNTYGSSASPDQLTPGFPVSPFAHRLHMPNPGYPYSVYEQWPYSNSPYF